MCLGLCILDFFNALFSFAFCVDTIFLRITLIAICWISYLHKRGIDFWASAIACGVTAWLAVVGISVTFQWLLLEVKENVKSATNLVHVAARLSTHNCGSVKPGNTLRQDVTVKLCRRAIKPCWDSSTDCASISASTVWLSIAWLQFPYTNPVADCDMSSWDMSGNIASVVAIFMPLQL